MGEKVAPEYDLLSVKEPARRKPASDGDENPASPKLGTAPSPAR